MFYRKWLFWLFALTGAFTVGAPGAGVAKTGFGLPLRGEKMVKISDQVGTNQIAFVSTAPLEEIHGTASEISGVFSFDPAGLETFQGRVQVSVRSMRTGISKRDGHLFSEDWLDAGAYPHIVFEVTGLEEVEPVKQEPEHGRSTVKGMAVGVFSLHGVSREIRVPFEATYILESDRTRKRAPGDFVMVQTEFQITLKDFEIQGARGLVGSRVGEVIDVKASVFGSTALEPEKE